MNIYHRAGLAILSLISAAIGGNSCLASGIYVGGYGARSAALGGAEGVAAVDDIISIMGTNPAGLGMMSDVSVGIGATGLYGRGRFTDKTGSGGRLDSNIGIAPEAAVAFPIGNSSLTLGVGLLTDAGLQADWNYVDPAGGWGGTTSYGEQNHFSEIILVRTTVGLAYRFNEQWSLGAGVGVAYNENRLKSPYTFQSQPVLQGFKTLLDLDTEGFGVNGTVGLVYRPDEDTVFGLSYISPTRITSTGTASGNADAQLDSLGAGFDGVQRDFNYDAEIVNRFPQKVSAGLAWNASPQTRLYFQVDYVNWNDSFDHLNVSLSNGNNADLNGLVGSDSMNDTIPLEWEDQFIYRAGLEYFPAEHWALRLGYSYGNNPVPSSTLTPMTAAIIEHTIAAGIGYQIGGFRLDLAYQMGLPNSVSVETSKLLSGEYDNSEIEVELHILRLSASYTF